MTNRKEPKMPDQKNQSMNNGSEPASKLTKRELLAGMAMQGFLVSENNETMKCPNNANFRYTWPGRNESYCCRFHSTGIETVANAIGMYLQLIPLSSDSKIPCNSGVTQETLYKMITEVEQNDR